MRRLVPSLVAALATLAFASGAEATKRPKQAPTPAVPTQATVDACHPAPDQPSRYVEFLGQMATVAGAKKMLMRFDLQVRRGHHRFHLPRRSPAGFGVWRTTASPSVDIFRLRKQVTNLFAPADYRAIVRFRWVAADGTVLKHVRLRTPVCRQPDPRPDLQIGGLSAQASPDGSQVQYFVDVLNAGHSDAGAFAVDMSVDGAPQPAQTITSLGAGAQQLLTFAGPACRAGGPGIKVRVDPDNRVAEAVERNDVRTFACPL